MQTFSQLKSLHVCRKHKEESKRILEKYCAAINDSAATPSISQCGGDEQVVHGVMASQAYTDEGCEQLPDVTTWLTQNRLMKYHDQFQEDDVVIAEILAWDEDTISQVAKDYGMNTVHLQRLQGAVRTLQHHVKPPSRAMHRIYRVVASIKESESIQQIDDKLSAIDVALRQCSESTDATLQECAKFNAHIEQTFTAFVQKLNNRKSELINELNVTQNAILSQLKTLKIGLRQHQTSLVTAKHESNDLMLDPSMDCHERETKIVKLASDAIGNIDDTELTCKPTKVAVEIDADAFERAIAEAGCIGDAAAAAPPNEVVPSACDCKEETLNLNGNSGHSKPAQQSAGDKQKKTDFAWPPSFGANTNDSAKTNGKNNNSVSQFSLAFGNPAKPATAAQPATPLKPNNGSAFGSSTKLSFSWEKNKNESKKKFVFDFANVMDVNNNNNSSANGGFTFSVPNTNVTSQGFFAPKRKVFRAKRTNK